MADPAARGMNAAQFFAWQERQDELYELVAGRVVPRGMTGATQRHDLVVTNALTALKSQLRGGPCRPTTADVALETGADRIRRPDLTVDGAPLDPRSRTTGTPVLVLEVLSPSTERVDTLVKLDEYKSLPSLRHILIAEPGAAHVLHYTRGPDGVWHGLDHIGLDTVLDLSGLACSLSLADLYEGVPLEDAARG